MLSLFDQIVEKFEEKLKEIDSRLQKIESLIKQLVDKTTLKENSSN